MSSRQIQIRRGTSEQHENFTGALGEVTMDTTNKTLRIHDGETAGGVALAKQEDLDTADYVIEYQTPTAENGYTWYRKYKSGWVEFGGRIKGGFSQSSSWNTRTINLPLELKDTSYIGTVVLQWNYSSGVTGIQDEIYVSTGTTTSMTLRYFAVSSSSEMFCIWRAIGTYEV